MIRTSHEVQVLDPPPSKPPEGEQERKEFERKASEQIRLRKKAMAGLAIECNELEDMIE
jgi:hypothetical protein